MRAGPGDWGARLSLPRGVTEGVKVPAWFLGDVWMRGCAGDW